MRTKQRRRNLTTRSGDRKGEGSVMGIDIFHECGPSAADCDLSTIEINQEYAKRLEYNKRREALQRYEDYRKRGLDGDSSESSDDSSGVETGNPSAKEVLQFFDAIALIKKKDPILLQKDTKLFSSSSSEEEEEAEEKKPKTARKEKTLYLKDVMARQLIEDGPEFEEVPLRKNPKVYSTEQVEGIKAFLEAEKVAFGSGNDDDDDIIRLKESSGNDAEDDGFIGEIQKKADEIFEEDDNDMFLKKFLLNKGWVEKVKDERPSFDDIGISEDEDELEKQDKYEAEYNFRHEERQDDRVLGHSRIMEGSVRKKNNSRKVQRKNKEERMMQAEIERKEELKHMKNLKKKEIQEKLDRIRVTAGIGEDGSCNLDASHLEEDFDPEKYDRTMKAMFGVDYYNDDDVDPTFGSDADNDIEKPDFDKEDKLLGVQKVWDSVDTMEGFEALRKIMSGKNKVEEVTQEQGKKKREQKISLREKVELDKELEEYYKLDYEGTVGDLKTRFKYRYVPANSYGLHTEEILMANDKDLNQYVSLKRLAPFKEEWKVTYHQKLKKSVILHGVKLDSKTSVMKHGTGKITNRTNADKKAEYKEANGDANILSKRSRKRRRHAQLKLSKSRLIAYGKISSKRQKT